MFDASEAFLNPEVRHTCRTKLAEKDRLGQGQPWNSKALRRSNLQVSQLVHHLLISDGCPNGKIFFFLLPRPRIFILITGEEFTIHPGSYVRGFTTELRPNQNATDVWFSLGAMILGLPRRITTVMIRETTRHLH
jgi:hypothetical protein